MKEYNRHAICFVFLLLASCFMLLSFPADASYKSVLKKWTRHDKVFVWDNLEARLIWHATYLSEEFQEKRDQKLTKLYEWPDEEKRKHEKERQLNAQKQDLFFLSLYAGSSEFLEIGKDTGKWKIVLEVEGKGVVKPLQFERVPVTQVERALYPYLDKWSKAYLVKFPKTIQKGKNFRLRITGLPARSELVWK